MNSIGKIAREVIGLFVDDGSFAIQIILWIVVVYALSRVVPRSMPEAFLLFAGLVAFLAFTVLRFARLGRAKH